MREPTEQQQKLHALVGTWMGEDMLYPAPFNPTGGTATTTYTGRVALNGLFVIDDDVQEQDGRVGFLAHKVYGYDPDEDVYTFHLFDSLGAHPATPARGTWEGNVLQFERATPATAIPSPRMATTCSRCTCRRLVQPTRHSLRGTTSVSSQGLYILVLQGHRGYLVARGRISASPSMPCIGVLPLPTS